MDEPPEPSAEGPLEGRIEEALGEAGSLGIVQLTEAGVVDPRHHDALTALRDRGPLPVRVRLLLSSGLFEREPSRLKQLGDPWLEILGVKFYADGWLGPATCALCEPFTDRDDNGVLFQDAVTLARRVEPVAEAGFTPATHAIGDRAIESVLDAYDNVYGSDCPSARPRIEHAQVLRADLIDRMADMGVVACIQPSFAVSDAAAAQSLLGEERSAVSYRWDLLLDAGVDVIGGSDYPIEPLAPLVGLQHLVTGLPLDADEGTDPIAVRLPYPAALALMTDGGAGETVLSDDPASVDPQEIASVEVLEVRPAS